MSDIVVNGGIQFAIRLRGLIFIPVISGTLGVANYGAYSQIIALSQFVAVVFGLGLPKALVRFGQSDEYDSDNLYYSLLAVGLLSCSAICAVVFSFSEFVSILTLSTPEYATAFRVGSLLIVTRVVIRMGRNYFRMDSRLKTFSVLQGIKAYLLVGGVTVAVLLLDGAVTEIMLTMVVIEALFAVFVHVPIVRELGLAVPTFPDLREQLRFSVPISVSNVASNFSSRADRLVIGFFLGATAVGSYSIAYQLAVGITIFMMPITQVFFPKISSFVEDGDYQRSAVYIWQGIRYFLLIAVPSAGGLYLVGPEVSALLTGTTENLPSGVLMLVIASGIVFKGIDRIYSVVIDAEKWTARLSAIRVTGAVLNVVLNVAIVPMYGVLGAAITTLVTYLFTATAVYVTSRQIISSPVESQTALKICVSTACMVGVVRLLEPSSIPVTIVLGISLYGLCIVASREVTLGELRKLSDTN